MTYNLKLLHFSLFTLALFFYTTAIAHEQTQEQTKVVRIAKLIIDSMYLEKYKLVLREHAETAVLKEAGVLTLYGVYEKNNPTHVTVFEIYANTDAYSAHLKTPHFLKYKIGTKNMVKSLELIETVPIVLESKK